MENAITLIPSTLSKEVKRRIRETILQAEEEMKSKVEGGDIVNENSTYHIKHYFTDGVYARELTIPAGQVVVGKIHKHEHLNFISKGRVTVLTEDGGREEFTAPVTLISPIGVKRLLYTHEETVWTVIHATSETSLDKVEADVIADSYEDLQLILGEA